MTTTASEPAIPMLVLLSRRESLEATDFRAYWQDVHGPLAARLPGLYHYRQLHLRWAPDWWPVGDGVGAGHPGADLVDGIADMAFASPQGQQAYAQVAHFTRNDEVNAFRRSVRYLGDAATVREAAARVARPPIAGGGVHLCALLRRRLDGNANAFADGLRRLFAPLHAQGRATVWTLAHRDNDANHLLAAHVDHDTPNERQYQAVVEVGFADAFEARAFLFDPAFVEAQGALVATVHAYRVEQVAPMLLQGRMTLSGSRGHTVARLIERVGATNQVDEAVLFLFGRRLP